MMWLDLFLQQFVQALASITAFAAVLAVIFGVAWLLSRLGRPSRAIFRAALRVARRDRDMGRRS